MVTLDQASADENIRLFRKDVRSLKKQIISANIELTDTEAQQFWTIYDRYTAAMRAGSMMRFCVISNASWT